MQHLKTLSLIFFITIITLGAFSQIANKPQAISVNQQRIENRIFELAKFGKDSLGRGVSGCLYKR